MLESLGHFVLAFAFVENVMQGTLRALGRVSDQFARAALAGVRVDVAMESLTRYFEVTNAPTKQRAVYSEIFSYVRSINKARNLILHYGVTWGEGGFTASDAGRALTPDRIRRLPVTEETLDQMSDDLWKAASMLILQMLKAMSPTYDATTNVMYSTAQEPWLYRPAEQTKQKKNEG